MDLFLENHIFHNKYFGKATHIHLKGVFLWESPYIFWSSRWTRPSSMKYWEICGIKLKNFVSQTWIEKVHSINKCMQFPLHSFITNSSLDLGFCFSIGCQLSIFGDALVARKKHLLLENHQWGIPFFHIGEHWGNERELS